MSEMPERQSPVPDPKRSGGMLTPAAVPEPTLEGQIAEVLARHAVTFPRGYANECCICGWESDLGQHPESQGAAHLAAVLSPLVVEVRERAVEEALDAAAMRIEAKIVHVPDAAVDSGGFETDMDVGCEIAYTRAARIVRAGGRP